MTIPAWQALVIDEDAHDITTCACCDTQTHRALGDVRDGEVWLCWYTCRWTDGHMDRGLSFDLFFGDWREGAAPDTRWIVSVLYRKAADAFSVQDARNGRRWDKAGATVMNRDDVIGTDFAQEVFAILDAIFMKDPRLGIWRT